MQKYPEYGIYSSRIFYLYFLQVLPFSKSKSFSFHKFTTFHGSFLPRLHVQLLGVVDKLHVAAEILRKRSPKMSEIVSNIVQDCPTNFPGAGRVI